MNLPIVISLASVLLSLAALGFALKSRGKNKKNLGLLEFAYAQVEELENSLAAGREQIAALGRRDADQARRIAWLETRFRQPKLASKDVLDETILTEAPKPASITERRHRVLTLASRGQNIETIAAALGMLPGEVELIINLNRAGCAGLA